VSFKKRWTVRVPARSKTKGMVKQTPKYFSIWEAKHCEGKGNGTMGRRWGCSLKWKLLRQNMGKKRKQLGGKK